MNCEWVRKNCSLFLYGELALEQEQEFQDHLDGCEACKKAFEAERAIHEALDAREKLPPAALLARCRRDLDLRVGFAREGRGWKSWLKPLFGGWSLVPALSRAAIAVALVALGFGAARWTAPAGNGSPRLAGTLEPAVAHVRFLQPEPSGKVRLVVEETRQRLLTGDPQDAGIQRLLLAAARESSDPGLRAESMDILRSRAEPTELRGTLLYALQRDPNPGVRLRALDALKPYAGDPQVQSALAQVLRSDDNPGVRTQAIDLLVQHKEESMVGLLQELIQREDNNYVRLRCQRALQEMNASVGTF